MTVYGYATHRWTREEITPGVWLSLGLKVDDEVAEVTPRKFFSFKVLNGTADGTVRRFKVTESVTFDHIVVARKPAGPVADVLYNGRPQQVPAGWPVEVTPHWNEDG